MKKYDRIRLILLTTVLVYSMSLNGCESSETAETPFSVEEPVVVSSGYVFTEGPLWHPDGFLLFSDIPANRIYQWIPGDFEGSVYVEPSGNSNGIKAGPDGEIIVAQHAGRVSRLTGDLELVPIAEEYEGKRLNSPNDIAIRSDGLIYFTDPYFGVSAEDRELDISGVYRINHDESVTLVFDGFDLPNGIVFSPDESQLYVNDSATGDILKFEVADSGDLMNPELFANIGPMDTLGGADGMVTDSEGRLYTTGPNGLIIFDEAGNRLEQIRFDQQITNLAWGGEDGRDLYITSRGDIFMARINR